MPGGELYQLLTKERNFDEAVSRSIISQILLGLQYLHINHIIHSGISLLIAIAPSSEAHSVCGVLIDLKPENVMIDQTRGPPYVVKIADFGLSEVISTSSGPPQDQCVFR